MTADRGRPARSAGSPRYGRLALVVSAVTVTALSVLGGLGTLPTSADPGSTAATGSTGTPPATEGLRLSGAAPTATPAAPTVAPEDATSPAGEPAARLPGGSGTGRRVVLSESRQRVWLVGHSGAVRRTYPVSGSISDNLDPGTYAVFSRSGRAWGIDDSGSMRWFVRFAHGERAAIGFHDIPVVNGQKVQTVDQLGTPLSHGCIRQRTADALALWRFAPIGTTVVVTD